MYEHSNSLYKIPHILYTPDLLLKKSISQFANLTSKKGTISMGSASFVGIRPCVSDDMQASLFLDFFFFFSVLGIMYSFLSGGWSVRLTPFPNRYPTQGTPSQLLIFLTDNSGQRHLQCLYYSYSVNAIQDQGM